MNPFKSASCSFRISALFLEGPLVLLLAGPTLAQVTPIYPKPFPETVYVDVLATGANTGQSWTDAFTTLDPALVVAAQDAEIWVADGTYKPASSTTGYLVDKRVKLYGGFDGGEIFLADRDPLLFEHTILSADLGQPGTITDNADHVLTIQQVAGVKGAPGVEIDGFQIRDGFASSPSGSLDLDGGGIYSYCSDLELANCFVRKNSARYGGGLYFKGGCHNPPISVAVPNTLRVKKCEFGNAVNNGTDKNQADVAGGAIFGERVNGYVVNTKFLWNNATVSGGGVFLWKMRLDNRIEFTNCAFWQNHSGEAGAGMYLGEVAPQNGADVKLVNCAFAWNNTSSCDNGTALFVSPNSIATVFNSILYHNYAPTNPNCGLNAPPIFGSATVRYSDVQGGFVGTNNVSVDPLFTSLSTFDLRLGQVTDCVDSADYLMLPQDYLDVNDDGNTGQPVPIDLSGGVRLVDDQGATNQGNPPGSDYLDMGAYERP